MKSLTEYIVLEAAKKLSATGKKKLEKQVEKWISNIDEFYKEIGTSKGDDHYDEVSTVVWNFLDDSGILSMDCQDSDSNEFVDEQIIKICNELEK